MARPLRMVLLLAGVVACCGFFLKKNPVKEAEGVETYFVTQLQRLRNELKEFRLQLDRSSSPNELNHHLGQLRLRYKRLAVLTDYFNPFETIWLNGPAQPRAEDDNPTVILQPHGLQVIEALLNEKRPDHVAVLEEVRIVDSVLQRLETEPERRLKFMPVQVWTALQNNLIALVTLDLANADAPLLQSGLAEAAARLEGTEDLTRLFAGRLPGDPLWSEWQTRCAEARALLEHAGPSERFDRLGLLRRSLLPAYRLFVQLRVRLNVLPQSERYPVNFTATSLFDTAFFDRSFFSPNERYRATPQRVALGQRLFFDPLLSGNGKQSCAGCHDPAKAFTDGQPQALGLNGRPLLRNTPTLWNTVFQTRQFYDSRTATLENQLNAVVHNTEEMKGSLKEIAVRLKANAEYRAAFSEAYASEREPFTDYTIANAVSSYVRSLVSLNSPFDRYMRGDETAIDENARQGFNLFLGKAQCGSCHYLPLFNGLVPPNFTETESEGLGLPAYPRSRRAAPDRDPGKGGFTGAATDSFTFKTPTLRNLAKTAPYMHNGVFQSLEEVIDFYNRGGRMGFEPPMQTTLSRQKLGLSRRERRQLLAFLNSLNE